LGLLELDGHQRIARLAKGAGATLALEADLLVFLDLFRKLHRQHLARRHAHRDRGGLVSILERHGDGDDDVLALGGAGTRTTHAAPEAGGRAGDRVPLGAAAWASTATRLAAEAAHEFLEDVLGGEPTAAGRTAARAGAAETATAEAGEARIAVGVDLATVILR